MRHLTKLFYAGIFSFLIAGSVLITGCPSKSSPTSTANPTPTPYYSTSAVTVFSGTGTFVPRSINYYNGDLWIANSYTSAGAMDEYTTAGLAVTAISTYSGSNPFDGVGNANIGPDGTIYVPDWGNGQVEVFSSSGTYQTLIPGFTKTTSVAITSDGLILYVLENSSPVSILIYAIDNSTNPKTFVNAGYFSTTSSGVGTLMAPQFLALDSNNNVYVTNLAVTPNIVKYGPTGANPVSFGTPALTLPWGIVVDSAGNVLVSDCNLPGFIQEFNPSGSTYTAGVTFGNNASYRIDSLTLDGSGNLYAADYSGMGILEFTNTN